MTAHAVAARVRAAYWPPLVQAVRSLDQHQPQLALVLGYHLGLNDTHGTPGSGDDGLASTLCLAGLGACAAGADHGQATACALAVELTKDFIQLEDDILDNDFSRRGRASAWRAFGTPATLLTIDVTRALAFDLLTATGPHPLRAARHLQRYADAVARGQAADLAAESRPWTGKNQVTLAEYKHIIEDKGAAMVVAALTLGAVLTDAPPVILHTLTRAGTQLGMAWQIFDDLTDIWNAHGPRAFSSDLARGKKSYPVITAISSGAAEADTLAELLARHPATAQDVRTAAGLIEACGGRHATEQRVKELCAAALDTLAHPDLDRASADDIAAIASVIGTRGTESTLTVGTPAIRRPEAGMT
ncbi:polyprenyl synthetase family protein [Streptomyces qinzhouensis]|uniref:Polyprenyl synthetase family protein n=1 Tax=Streptomyces qinzhouensis TaxID=2599401 RepID=A0A5B8J7Z5_9ACTN|nr:polyprenyl synthetase family protein [Streptomyces qinzhouensis]QDY77386.1 hypothetical protein FQU76_13595 [Streptomyces qinzhouensis]